jgi:hypothetical protein
MEYDERKQSLHLLQDLADGISGIDALDQAVSVLIEWGLIDPNLASQFIKELQEAN